MKSKRKNNETRITNALNVLILNGLLILACIWMFGFNNMAIGVLIIFFPVLWVVSSQINQS